MIHPEKNAFAVLQHSTHHDKWIAGRVIAWEKDAVHVQVGPGDVACALRRQWRLMHWHNQPVEADDSPAWRATREAIAKAMVNAAARRNDR